MKSARSEPQRTRARTSLCRPQLVQAMARRISTRASNGESAAEDQGVIRTKSNLSNALNGRSGSGSTSHIGGKPMGHGGDGPRTAADRASVVGFVPGS